MTLQRQRTGRRGERLAEQYLVSLGARVLARNYRVPYAEVDLILEHVGELVAVEVKTRDVEDFVAPEECVYWSQLRRVVRGLATFANENQLLDVAWRIDVIVIVICDDGEVLRFNHLEGVYPG